ncbi:hypothetical protein [Pinibacter soli]|uniref:Glycosyltransferase family 2 protein n=1 Tax=Pinibacter soli TaxID=3044211 RepID=A0ABT6RCG4_9BACT|nr:hypothetical protein [Pinibacter soli]MDI3320262.1 hypothetical protein [Pinibacter soli]
MNHTLVITSAVYVNSNFTVLTDAKKRLEQYVESIKFYLSSTQIKNIIICDNSGFDYSSRQDLATLARENDKRLECYSFHGDKDNIFKKGKGYGEGEMLKYLFSESKLLNQQASFCKVTGRLVVNNIDQVLKAIKKDQNYFQIIGLNPFKKRDKIDTRFYHCKTKTFVDYLINEYPKVDDNSGVYLEHLYYNALTLHRRLFRNFKTIPDFEGVSGSTGLPYKRTKFKLFIQKLANKVLAH